MERVTRDHTVPPERRHEVQEPVAQVGLGEGFVVETVNFRTPIIRTPADANPEHYREREESGPIFVKGIEPRDVLAIDILDIRPEGHASGGWWDDPEVNSFLDIRDGRVHFPGGLSVPLHMMIGDIRVQPVGEVPNPWDNGGNMDFKNICAGNTLLLRAELPGGLLVLGDLHAAQGDGELLGLGAECAGEVTLRVRKEESWPVRRPTIRKDDSFLSIACRKDDSFLSIACRRDYPAARDLAIADATDILAHIAGSTREEAYLYVTTVGDLRNGAVWPMKAGEQPSGPPLVVGVEVPLACFKETSE